jgi:WhiB family transcriptional regulator, redox-sensing transcriptional regulator
MTKSTEWRTSAKCRGLDPVLFSPTEWLGPAATRLAEARRICASCPVAAECVAENPSDPWTIRGGLTPTERRAKWVDEPRRARPYSVAELELTTGRPMTTTRLSRWAGMNGRDAKTARETGLTRRQAERIVETLSRPPAKNHSVAEEVVERIGIPTLRTLWPTVNPDDVLVLDPGRKITRKTTETAPTGPEIASDPFAWVPTLHATARRRRDARLLNLVDNLRRHQRKTAAA